MASFNHIKNVAIVGAGGNSGKYMTEELLKTGKHNVTALSRADSNATLPKGVIKKIIDYDNPSSLVEALQGQDALIITVGIMAPPDTTTKLIQAAADANVPWVLPNEWSPDTANEALVKDVRPFQKGPHERELIKKLGKSSYVSVVTGFWYEWSLAIKAAYGFDFENRAVTFFDEGETKISMTTWPQVGRAVAGLLSLPIQPGGDDKEKCLGHFRNQIAYVSSFTVSQKDILDSVLRVTNTTLDEWQISKEPSEERYTGGVEAMQKGDRMGFLKMMYTRVFYPDGCGDYEKSRGTANAVLGLPREDLDEATRAAIKRSKEVTWGH
ncbi:MAG: hypothetical protein MMC33_001583 [Icmadophila ericetorum]|nr:hypothetical protein [Icmadophila ericetorum]